MPNPNPPVPPSGPQKLEEGVQIGDFQSPDASLQPKIMANSYALARDVVQGFSIDVAQQQGNKRTPVRFQKRGDAIDLSKVDIPGFVRSSINGDLKRLFISGMLRAVQQEVTEAFDIAIRREVAKYGHGYQDQTIRIVDGQANVRVLEPGVQVEQRNIPEPPEVPAAPQARSIQPQAEIIEDGVQVGSTLPAEPVPELPWASTNDVSAATGEPPSPYKDWAVNKDFNQQKQAILESNDLKFLRYVSETGTKQFKKLAVSRMESLPPSS